MARRLARAELPKGRLLEQPAAVVRYLMLHYDVPGQEVVGALYLDVRGRLVGEREVYRGTLHKAVLEPRGIFKEALACDASSVLIFHTHPSGDPSPSSQDLAVTRRLASVGDLLGIPVVDHLILGSGARWVSLRRHCREPTEPRGTFQA
jgi:DNA repair protein RadC